CDAILFETLGSASRQHAEAVAGSHDQVNEPRRNMRMSNVVEDLLQDVIYAMRMLRRSPGFTIAAIAALAVGIGANTAIFSVINTVLLQPLAYPEPDRLVQLELSSPQGNGNVTSIPKFNVWREQTQAFQDVAAYDFGGPGVNLTGGDRPEQLKG